MRYTFDSREVKPGMGFVALKGEKADGHAFIPQALERGAAEIVDGLDALQEKARERRRSLKAKVVGLTGSAGKTTTKELLRTFLSTVGRTYATEGNFNNHIGLPLTILNCPDDADVLVLEMGSNHPGEIAALCDIAAPDAGVITNVGTAHLEFFKTQDGIAEEKGALFEAAKDFCVVSAENVRLDALRARCGSAECIVVDPHPAWLAEALAPVLPGVHNVSNAALAFAAAERFGATREGALSALSGFALPGARWRRVEKWGATFVDDTYNANPDSMVAALDAFASMPCKGRKIAILGDMFELGERAAELHAKVFDHAAGLGFAEVIAVGETSSKCRADAAFRTVAELAAVLADRFAPGDAVLLKASHGLHLGDVLGQ